MNGVKNTPRYAMNSRLYARESEMDRDELRAVLNNIRNERFMSKIIDDVAKAARAAGNMGWFDFLEMEILKHHGIAPKLNVVPPTKRILVDDFLDEAYKYHLLGAFKHRDDPEMFEAYCHPMSDKRGRYLDEMTTGQRKVFSMMNEDIIAAKKRQRQRGGESSTIEDALNDAVRKSINEKGSDTPK